MASYDSWKRWLQSPRAETADNFKDSCEQENRREQNTGETTNNEPNSPSTNFAALISAIKDEGTAYRQEEQREDRGKKFREWLTIILIACTLAAISWQVHEMIKVYEPIREQAEAARKSADAAAESAEAAKSQADAMTKQADSSARQAEISAQAIIGSERAWVGPTNASFSSEPAVGKPIETLIQYHNTGREPALSFVARVTPFSATVEEDTNGTLGRRLSRSLDFCKGARVWDGGSVIYPTTGFSSFNLGSKTAEEFVDEAITRGEKIVFIEGCFLYKSFDKPRHSYFCFFYKKGLTNIQNLNICQTGHYAD